jgi:hypothetical protein
VNVLLSAARGLRIPKLWFRRIVVSAAGHVHGVLLFVLLIFILTF